MMSRRALVVDDSRSARAFLTRILERYELAVDGVESAEQAIEYLTRQRPDVIFMDHLMPGMDGFQAVQAIKNNPLTATIPIMMYTSQEGELYLSQARALGAIGVLPKQTKHTDVSKALDQLNLLTHPRLESEIIAAPQSGRAERPAGAVAGATTSAAAGAVAAAATGGVAGSATGAEVSPLTDTTTTVELRVPPRETPFVERRGKDRPNLPALPPEVRSIVEALVSHHMRDLQRFVSDSLETQADRVVGDVRLLLKDQPPPTASPVAPPPEPHTNGGFWVGLAGVAVACLVGWQWQQQRVDSAALSAQLQMSQQQLGAAQEQLQSLQASGSGAAAGESGAASASEAANVTIEPVPYGETPLAGSRLERVQSLLARLNSQGFRGMVEIRSIPGRFCMVSGSTATPVLAADSAPFSKCDQVGNPRDDNGSASQRQSVAFANMIATARQNGSGRLDIQIGAGTPEETLTPYPPVTEGLMAGEWNRAAATNNRVEVHWQTTR